MNKKEEIEEEVVDEDLFDEFYNEEDPYEIYLKTQTGVQTVLF